MRATCRILILFSMSCLFLDWQFAMAGQRESDLQTPTSERKISQSRTANSQFEPRPLIASEEEVIKFLDTYIDRYTRKEVDGLLLLFSSKAVQNRQQGFEEIRTAYTSFCDRSEEIYYRLEDVKKEIYENGVEIKAHYELVQLLKDGEKKRWKGRIRWLLVKEDGAIKILFLDFQNL